MKYSESNFTYIRKSNMSDYYEELARAEYLCEEFPDVTKIIIRKVTESLLRNLVQKYYRNIDSNLPTGALIEEVKKSGDVLLPEEIYSYINLIRVNALGLSFYKHRNEISYKHPIELLEYVHKILCWYIRETQPGILIGNEDMNFEAPSKIEFDEKELAKVRNDIKLKDVQISNLREQVIKLIDEGKSITQLNQIIIAIKAENDELKNIERILSRKVKLRKYEIENLRNNHERYITNFNILKSRCIESHELLANKESVLVRIELDGTELKTMVKNLEYEEKEIRLREQLISRNLDEIRASYEKYLDLTNQYQDIIETITFSYNDNLKSILQNKKNSINIQANVEDKKFYNFISFYKNDVEEVKRKIKLFREIVNGRINREIKHEEFYKGFLNIKGKQLRTLYSIINIACQKENLLNKSKDWFFKFNEEKFTDKLNKNLEELKSISDCQIKLILYYKLMSLSKVPVRNICNRREFIKTLDAILNAAHEVLSSKENFDFFKKKEDSIRIYYLKNLIENLKNRYIDIDIDDELIDELYNKIILLSINKELVIYERLKVEDLSRETLEKVIIKDPFEILSIILDMGNGDTYIDVYRIIFKIVILMNNKVKMEKDAEEISFKRFLNGPFRVMIFVSNGGMQIIKKPQELLPLIVAEILLGNINDENEADLSNYQGMVEIWKANQEKYNDLFIKKKNLQSGLNTVLNEQKNIAGDLNELLMEEQKLVSNYRKYSDDFKRIVLSSTKSTILPAYKNYKELAEKSGNNTSSSNNAFLESIMKHASNIMGKSSLEQAEKILIKQARESSHFDSENRIFTDLNRRLKDIREEIDYTKGLLNKKNDSINEFNSKIEKLQKSMKSIKDIYLDMHEEN